MSAGLWFSVLEGFLFFCSSLLCAYFERARRERPGWRSLSCWHKKVTKECLESTSDLTEPAHGGPLLHHWLPAGPENASTTKFDRGRLVHRRAPLQKTSSAFSLHGRRALVHLSSARHGAPVPRSLAGPTAAVHADRISRPSAGGVNADSGSPARSNNSQALLLVTFLVPARKVTARRGAPGALSRRETKPKKNKRKDSPHAVRIRPRSTVSRNCLRGG